MGRLKPFPGALVLFWLAVLAPAADLNLFFTGEIHGNYGPCGCDNNPTGGLARRAGYARMIHAGTGTQGIHVDCGNYFSARGPHAERVNAFMLEGIRRLPISVINLAPEDLYFWPQLASEDLPGAKVISSNLTPLLSSAPRPQASAIVTVPAKLLSLKSDLRIGFLGISDPARVKPNSSFRARDPVEAVAEIMSALASQVDFVVLLADIKREPGPLPEDSVLHRIASTHPEIAVIISTEKRYLLHEPEQVRNAVVLSSVERGRYLGKLLLKLDREGRILSYEPEFIEMKEGIEEDTELLEMQRALDSRLFPRPR